MAGVAGIKDIINNHHNSSSSSDDDSGDDHDDHSTVFGDDDRMRTPRSEGVANDNNCNKNIPKNKTINSAKEWQALASTKTILSIALVVLAIAAAFGFYKLVLQEETIRFEEEVRDEHPTLCLALSFVCVCEV